eukprot:s3937_g1.t3
MTRVRWLLLGSLPLLYAGMERLFMIPFQAARPQHVQHQGFADVDEVDQSKTEFGSMARLSVAVGALVLAIFLRPSPAQAIPLEMLKRLEQEQVRAEAAEAKGKRPNTEAPPVLVQSDAAAVSLAQRLREGGATFYGTFWCPACDAQRQLFGLPAWQSEAWQQPAMASHGPAGVPYVECDARNSQGQPQRCAEAGVDAIPFWTFADGSTHSGVMSVSDPGQQHLYAPVKQTVVACALQRTPTVCSWPCHRTAKTARSVRAKKLDDDHRRSNCDPCVPVPEKVAVHEDRRAALEAARKELGEDVELKQDEDVLDTWFSSGLWPFATVGWPNEEAEDYKNYYPAIMMETGYDILFFWVARMVMMGLTLTDKAPFKEIYLHGLVRDEKGQKMSKTKGNVVDPLDSIADYGTDALRYALLTSSVPGMDVPISKGMLENAKAFANKIWNVGRFIITEYEKTAGTVQISFESGMTFSEEEIKAMPWLERALLSKCQGLCEGVTAALLENRFAPPTKDIKEFLQEDVAAWYVEASKTRLQEHLGGNPNSAEAATSQKVLLYLLEVSLKLLHPFMPFVTEAVWQRLPRSASSPDSLMISPWPKMSAAHDAEAEGWFEKFCAVTSAVRNARAEQGIPP